MQSRPAHTRGTASAYAEFAGLRPDRGTTAGCGRRGAGETMWLASMRAARVRGLVQNVPMAADRDTGRVRRTWEGGDMWMKACRQGRATRLRRDAAGGCEASVNMNGAASACCGTTRAGALNPSVRRGLREWML